MADRVNATITVGGALSSAQFAELLDVISCERLSLEWGGPMPEPSDITLDEPLMLVAHEVVWGRFEDLEAWCETHAIPYVRWAGSCPGSWGAERVVFTGSGSPQSYAADDEDRIVITRETVERLASVEAILALFTADFAVPPLVVTGESPPPTG